MFFQLIAEKTMAFAMKFREAKSQKRSGLDWLQKIAIPAATAAQAISGIGSSANWIREGRLLLGKVVIRRSLLHPDLRVARRWSGGGHRAFRIEQVIVAGA